MKIRQSPKGICDAIRRFIVLVFQLLLREGFLFLSETLLLELEFGLAFDSEFVIRDTRAELADAVV